MQGLGEGDGELELGRYVKRLLQLLKRKDAEFFN